MPRKRGGFRLSTSSDIRKNKRRVKEKSAAIIDCQDIDTSMRSCLKNTTGNITEPDSCLPNSKEMDYASKLERSCVLMILSCEQEMAIRQMFLDHDWECNMQVLTDEEFMFFRRRSHDIGCETFVKTEVPDSQESDNNGSETFVSSNIKTELDCNDQDTSGSLETCSVLAAPVHTSGSLETCSALATPVHTSGSLETCALATPVHTSGSLETCSALAIPVHTSGSLETCSALATPLHTSGSLDTCSALATPLHTSGSLKTCSVLATPVHTSGSLETCSALATPVHTSDSLETCSVLATPVHTSGSLETCSALATPVHTSGSLDTCSALATPVHTSGSLETYSVLATPVHASGSLETCSVLATPVDASGFLETRSVLATPVHTSGSLETCSALATPVDASGFLETRSVLATPVHTSGSLETCSMSSIQETPLILHCEQENTEQNDISTAAEFLVNAKSFVFMTVNKPVSNSVDINGIFPVYQIRSAHYHPVDRLKENQLFEHNQKEIIANADNKGHIQTKTFNAGTLESQYLTKGPSDTRKRKSEIKSKAKNGNKRLKDQTSALNLNDVDSVSNVCVDEAEGKITMFNNEMKGETPSAADVVTLIREACDKMGESDNTDKKTRSIMPCPKCEDCDETFSNKEQLREHSYETGHKIRVKKRAETNYQCEHCGQILGSMTRYSNHIKLRHTGVRDLQCPICKADFSSSDCLNSHLKMAHVYEPKVCHTCGLTLKNDFLLKKHMSRAHATIKYKCNVCNITLSRQDILMKHLKTKTHAKKRELQPDIGIEYETIPLNDSSGNVNTKLVGSANERDMTLNSLGINSSSENNVMNRSGHIVGRNILDTMSLLPESPSEKTISGTTSESDDRSPCISQDGAPTPEQENKILIVSKKREKYVCSVCGTSFIKVANLTSHLYSEHSEEVKKFDTLFCKVCGMKFTSAAELNSHRAAKGHRFMPQKCKAHVHKESICNKCGQKVKSLFNHQYSSCPMMQNVECDICGKQFDNKFKLKGHLKLMHVHEQKICQICKQVCRNNQAYQSHVKNHRRSVWCETCNKPFRDKYKLKEHCATQGHQQMLRLASQGNKDKPAFSACTLCDLKFALKSGLTFHMNRVHKHGN